MLGPLTVVAGMGLVVVAMGVVGYAYTRGYASCESDVAFNNAPVQEAAYQQYRQAVARADDISAKLAKTQEKLRSTEREYHTYANAITGNCNSDDFRVFVQHASGNTAAVPAAPSASSDGPTDDDPTDAAYEEAVARLIAGNVASNYARFNLCIAEKRALNEFHKPKESLNE